MDGLRAMLNCIQKKGCCTTFVNKTGLEDSNTSIRIAHLPAAAAAAAKLSRSFVMSRATAATPTTGQPRWTLADDLL